MGRAFLVLRRSVDAQRQERLVYRTFRYLYFNTRGRCDKTLSAAPSQHTSIADTEGPSSYHACYVLQAL